MTISALLSKTKIQKIGKTPMVVIPLSVWGKIENYIEDLEMINSPSLRKNIKKARAEVKKGLVVPFEEL